MVGVIDGQAAAMAKGRALPPAPPAPAHADKHRIHSLMDCRLWTIRIARIHTALISCVERVLLVNKEYQRQTIVITYLPVPAFIATDLHFA